MSEVLRTDQSIPIERTKRTREQLTFNMAELAVLSLINPTEIVRHVQAEATTLALDPELEIRKIAAMDLVNHG